MSIWQTQSWQDMLITSGQSEEYFIIEQDYKEDHDAAKEKIFVEKRRVSLGEYALFVIGFEGEIDERLWDSLKEICEQEKCLFIQIETLLYSYERQDINKKYYKKFIPFYTALIDLTQGEEEILAAMKQKGRYNIRLAAKKGVEVRKVEKTDKNIDVFHKLMKITNSRDKFVGNTRDYYKNFLDSITQSELYFAYHDTDVLAAGIFVFQEDTAYYYYGASSNHKRNLMAPYLLQWEAIQYAKAQGCKIYDFLGVAGDEETNSPLSGVTDFKMKLSPQKHYVSDVELHIHKKMKYMCIQLLKKLKNR